MTAGDCRVRLPALLTRRRVPMPLALPPGPAPRRQLVPALPPRLRRPAAVPPLPAACSGSCACSGSSAAGAGVSSDACSPAGASVVAASPSPTTAITAPTSTVSPSCTLISVSVPATGDGTSVSTLSVDTSKSGSSAATASPTALNHCVMVPSVTVSPSWGRVTSAMDVPFECVDASMWSDGANGGVSR